jgi:putative nucleotidyltransferase with HDIG domain
MRAARERVRQFREAGVRPTAAQFAWARDLIKDDRLFTLFARQEARDIVHAVRTAEWLLERGDDDRELLMAALLHDVGKGRQRTRDRIAWVMAETMGWERLLASPGSRLEVRRAMARTASHSRVGADLLEAAGSPAEVVRLTRLHHEEPGQDDMLLRLQAADAAS